MLDASSFGLAADELAVDNFAGGGGASSGITEAIGRDPDIALNHDAEACAMYRANHPAAIVHCQSVYKADPRDVVQEASNRRGSARPLPVGLAWFSPDCTDHSKAKGAAPIRNRASRDLAWVIPHWAKLVRPRIILMENVEEWLGWGPLRQRRWPDGRLMEDLHGNPVLERDPDRAGETFKLWLRKMRRYGYRVEYRLLRASELGAPTIRRRLYLVARCDGLPIEWPAATHAANDDGGLLPFRTAADCIDWSIPCPSIFGRKKDLVENTMARIGRGVWRYVIETGSPFIVPVTHAGDKRTHSIDEPLRTITCAQRGELALISPHITLFRTGATGHPMDEPMRTVTANSFVKRPGGAAPLGLVTAFLAQHNAGPRNENMSGRRVDAPISTITTTGGQQQLVTSHLIKMRGTCRDGQPVTEPMPTITGGGWHVGEVRAFLIKYFSTAVGQALDEPLHTATARARFGLVMVRGELYQIVDIGMRMLTPRELFRAQGFLESYIIDRGIFLDAAGNPVWRPLTKTAQIRMCGNSVCPPVAAALVRANIARPRPAGFGQERWAA